MVALVADDANAGQPLQFVDFAGVGECSANWTAVRDACLKLETSKLIRICRLCSIGPRLWCEILAREMKEGIIAPQRIAISLHGPDQTSRRQIIPHAEDPWEAATWWSRLAGPGCEIYLNYVVHQGNSQRRHLERLAEFLSANAHWVAEIRLAPLNPVPRMPLVTSEHFADFVSRLAERVPTRVHQFHPVGRSVAMACGQLRATWQNADGCHTIEHSVSRATSRWG
jgi:adenine C2-methylase RlmN of 23S rRNA A2503 and tRNA A37